MTRTALETAKEPRAVDPKAATDLLLALEAAWEWMDNCGELTGSESDSALVQQIMEAINKATGKPPEPMRVPPPNYQMETDTISLKLWWGRYDLPNRDVIGRHYGGEPKWSKRCLSELKAWADKWTSK